MPSANPKLEKQASTEAVEPIRQAIIVVEHKIRNLEKRKARLESYRDIVKSGGELEADQKLAVAKYDEVSQTLDTTREISKQIQTIANDATRQQKKVARKEALERTQQDIAKVREVLLIQDTLMNMGAQGVREDFINGTNGAIKLAEEDFKFLDDLYNEVMLKHDRPEVEQTFLQQAHKVAEHYVMIVDGKQKDVVGTTYTRLREIITSITQCGYFDQSHEVEVPVEEVTQAVAETHISNAHAPEQISEEFGSNSSTSERHIPAPQENTLPIQSFPVPVVAVPVVPGATPIPTPIPVVAQPIPAIPPSQVETSYYTNSTYAQPQIQQQAAQQQQQQPPQQPPQVPAPAPRINDVIGPSSSFFFLQESELDTPEIAAAAAASAASQQQAAQPVVPHIPVSATVVAAVVPLNAPIPTQTFTNQTFASHPVLPTQVMYPHQPQEITHLPSFGSSAAPTIPMSQAHQPSMQFNSPTQSGFPQVQAQSFEQMTQQESLLSQNEEVHESLDKVNDTVVVIENDVSQNGPSDWAQMPDGVSDWSVVDPSQQSDQDSQHLQNSQPSSWADQQRGGFRGRGGRRGNSNGYNNRGRGNYQQNGRGSYYRNNDGNNYQQNGYQRNWSNNTEGGNPGGYNPTFKRSTSNQPRGGPRGDRGGMDRGGRGGGGGQFRGNPRGGMNRPNYAPRGKPQMQN